MKTEGTLQLKKTWLAPTLLSSIPLGYLMVGLIIKIARNLPTPSTLIEIYPAPYDIFTGIALGWVPLIGIIVFIAAYNSTPKNERYLVNRYFVLYLELVAVLSFSLVVPPTTAVLVVVVLTILIILQIRRNIHISP